MNTATVFSSGFVTCLAVLSLACGGGGGDAPIASTPLPTTCASRMAANPAIVMCEDFGASLVVEKDFGSLPAVSDDEGDADSAYLASAIREEM